MLSQDYECLFEQPNFTTTSLVETACALSASASALELLLSVEPGARLPDPVDTLLGLVFPRTMIPMRRYYVGAGPAFAELANATTIRNVDQVLSEVVEALEELAPALQENAKLGRRPLGQVIRRSVARLFRAPAHPETSGVAA